MKDCPFCESPLIRNVSEFITPVPHRETGESIVISDSVELECPRCGDTFMTRSESNRIQSIVEEFGDPQYWLRKSKE